MDKLIREKESNIRSLNKDNETMKKNLAQEVSRNNLLYLEKQNLVETKQIKKLRRSLQDTLDKVKRGETQITYLEHNLNLRDTSLRKVRAERDQLQELCNSISNSKGMVLLTMRSKRQTTLDEMQSICNIHHNDFTTLSKNYTTLGELTKTKEQLNKDLFDTDHRLQDTITTINAEEAEYSVKVNMLKLNSADEKTKEQQKAEATRTHKAFLISLDKFKSKQERLLSDYKAEPVKLNKNFRLIHESNQTATERIQQNLQQITDQLNVARKSMAKSEDMTLPQEPIYDLEHKSIQQRSINTMKSTTPIIRKIVTTMPPQAPSLQPKTPEVPSTQRNTNTTTTETPPGYGEYVD